MTQKIFVASFTYGQAHLVKVAVKRDCPKTFTIAHEREFLIGGHVWLGNSIHKTKDRWFASGAEALDWLVKQARVHKKYQARSLESAGIGLAWLEDVQRMVEDETLSDDRMMGLQEALR